MIKRVLPPAAAPVELKSFFYAMKGFFCEDEILKKREYELKRFFGVKHIFLVSSGKAALYLILKSISKISKERSDVIVPAYTCFSVPSAIKKAGLKIELCDIEEKRFDFNYAHLRRLLDHKTLCVIGTHLFGIPIDIERLIEICHERGIFVIEDAAQAMGVYYKGKFLGTFGDIGFFSLGRGKNLCAGNGGIIITNSEPIASEISKEYTFLEKMKFYSKLREFLKIMLMDIFINPFLYWIPSSIKFLKIGETVYYEDFPVMRLSGVQAGFLSSWQERLRKLSDIRRKNSDIMIKKIGVDMPENIPYTRLPLILKDKETRDFLHNISKREGLGLEKMYPYPLNEIQQLREDFNGKKYPASKKISETLITLPTHSFLKEKDIEKITYIIQTCMK